MQMKVELTNGSKAIIDTSAVDQAVWPRSSKLAAKYAKWKPASKKSGWVANPSFGSNGSSGRYVMALIDGAGMFQPLHKDKIAEDDNGLYKRAA